MMLVFTIWTVPLSITKLCMMNALVIGTGKVTSSTNAPIFIRIIKTVTMDTIASLMLANTLTIPTLVVSNFALKAFKISKREYYC